MGMDDLFEVYMEGFDTPALLALFFFFLVFHVFVYVAVAAVSPKVNQAREGFYRIFLVPYLVL